MTEGTGILLRDKPGCVKGISPASFLCHKEPSRVASVQWLGSNVMKTTLALAVPTTKRGCQQQYHPTNLLFHESVVLAGFRGPSLCLSRFIKLSSFSVCFPTSTLSICVFSSNSFFSSVTDPKYRIPILFKTLLFF